MKIKYYLFLQLFLSIFFFSCGEDTYDLTSQGIHMPGRDCLACHNYDLELEKHLTIGGTVFKGLDINNVDDINSLCGGNLKVKFIDATNPSNVINSADYEDLTSKGYKGKGNIFILARKLPNLQGEFFIQITDENNNVIAVSNTPHSFKSGYYDINNPYDSSNRYSCNSCHSVKPKGGAPGVIFPNISSNLCK